MRKSGILFTTALILGMGIATSAHALSTGQTEMSNPNGTSRFTDPDDQLQGSEDGSDGLPATGFSTFDGQPMQGMSNLMPQVVNHPPVCTGTGCTCPGCKK